MNYGVQHRYYARPLEGWPPGQFPLGHWGVGGLGDANCDAGMPYDVNGNPCPTPMMSPSPTVSTAGAPTGSTLLYSATWQVKPAGPRPNQILASVLQNLQQSSSVTGIQVTNASQNSGFTTISDFTVQISLFVSGPGFAQPNDAGSIVDHAYNQVTGLMPPISATVVTALPSGISSAPAPTGTSPFGTPGAGASSTTMSDWFQSNAWWLVLAGVAAIAIPRLL